MYDVLILMYVVLSFISLSVPIAYHNSFFGDGLFPIVYSKMGCGGYEKTLGECDMNVYSEFSCSRDHVAGVLCGSGTHMYMYMCVHVIMEAKVPAGQCITNFM